MNVTRQKGIIMAVRTMPFASVKVAVAKRKGDDDVAKVAKGVRASLRSALRNPKHPQHKAVVAYNKASSKQGADGNRWGDMPVTLARDLFNVTPPKARKPKATTATK